MKKTQRKRKSMQNTRKVSGKVRNDFLTNMFHFSNNRCFFREGIDRVLWNEEDGTYYDFDLQNKQQRKSFFVTNVAPFWADCFK